MHGRDVVVTMLVEDEAILDVALGAGGLCDSLPARRHPPRDGHATASRRSASSKPRIAPPGQTLVAAPVLGRPDLAAAGQLGIVAAGPEDAVRTCEPLLGVIGRQTFPAGMKPESATAIKLANNAVLGCAMVAMAEGFSLVRKYGVVPQVFQDVMTEGLFSAPAYKVLRPEDGRRELRPGRVAHFRGTEGREPHRSRRRSGAGARCQATTSTHDRLLGAVAHGDGDRDQAVLAREQARASGLE